MSAIDRENQQQQIELHQVQLADLRYAAKHLRDAALTFAALSVVLQRRALLLPKESEEFEQACAKINEAIRGLEQHLL